MQGQPHHKKLASREVGLADYVPFSAHVTPSIIKNRDGCYLATWRLEAAFDADLRQDSPPPPDGQS